MSKKAAVRIGRLDCVGRVATEMARVYRQMRRGEIDTLDGARLIAALRELRCALEAGDIERRIGALEAQE